MKAPAAKKSSLSAADWILLSLAAGLFHAVLFTLFVPTELQDETRTARSRFTLMLQTDPLLQKAENDPYKLRYSLLYMNPEDLVKADNVNGFSRILNRQRITLPSPHACPHEVYDPRSHFPMHRTPILPPERFLDSFAPSSGLLQQKSRKKADAPERIPDPHYPLWIDHTRKVTTGFFLDDSISHRIFRRYRDHAKDVTLLRLDTEKGRIPSVVIRRSCGVPELDLLAVRQLSARKENYDFSAGREKRRTFYQVVWRPIQKSPEKEAEKK